MKKDDRTLVLYVPVLHQGYLQLFNRFRNIDTLYLIGDEIEKDVRFLEREIRAIPAKEMRTIIQAMGVFRVVRILTPDIPDYLLEKNVGLITVDEGISRRTIERFFPNAHVEYIPVFLRWDEQHVQSETPIQSSRLVSNTDTDFMGAAKILGQRSSDWWRQVGAILVKDGQILFEQYNQHMPSEHAPYAFGDIRDFITAGTMSEFSSSVHAEQAIITSAAYTGTSLKGSSIYVSVFPCAVCAKLIALSGITKCYYGAGHATFDGEKILNAYGVELIYIAPNSK